MTLAGNGGYPGVSGPGWSGPALSSGVGVVKGLAAGRNGVLYFAAENRIWHYFNGMVYLDAGTGWLVTVPELFWLSEHARISTMKTASFKCLT